MKRIPLTQGKYALVDDEDYERVINYPYAWTALKSYNTFYATSHECNKKRRSSISMHRFIMDVQDSRKLDHRNTNGLDNRKFNLRFATEIQNAQNQNIQKDYSSKYKGVYWNKQTGKWQTQIRLNTKLIYLGGYDNEIVAAWTYDQMAKELFKEFARLNFS